MHSDVRAAGGNVGLFLPVEFALNAPMPQNLELDTHQSSSNRIALRLTFPVPSGFESTFQEVLRSKPELFAFNPGWSGSRLIIDHTTMAGVVEAFDEMVASTQHLRSSRKNAAGALAHSRTGEERGS
jgi:hypothetical protein